MICCVWPVEEIVAAMMMDRLCKNMCRNGVWKIGEHLLEAQRWIREMTYEEIMEELDELDPKGVTSGIERDNFLLLGIVYDNKTS